MSVKIAPSIIFDPSLHLDKPVVQGTQVPVEEIIMDTSAPWCILDPAIVRRLGLAEVASYKPETKLIIRGIPYEGRLLRTGISLRDEYGENDLEVDATVFVPTLVQDEVWNHPNFIGLDGFLNRIRFAVDPVENAFYFGLLE